jgi:hypothetical protein
MIEYICEKHPLYRNGQNRPNNIGYAGFKRAGAQLTPREDNGNNGYARYF